MAHSKIGICNMALAMLGADSIRSFDEKNKRARMADVFFDTSRDYLISKFDWPFARTILKLQEVAAPTIDVPSGVQVYALPSDCATPRDLLPAGSKEKWEIISSYILVTPAPTGCDRLLKYTKRELDVTKYTDTFANLLALAIAVRMSPAITQDKVLTQALGEQLAIEQANAWESDANIGEDYRAYDEDPNNDTFVNPDGSYEDDILRG